MATVIVGAGIIGSATAFYLTELGGIDPSSIHIIESSPELVASASGYAGGFLARDWFAAPSASLGALSFDLHAQLAAKYNGAETWGYSKTTSYSLTSPKTYKTSKRGEDWLIGGSRASVSKIVYENKSENEPSWLQRADGDGLDMMGKDTSAQVDPRRLTLFLLQTALQRGVNLHQPCTPTKVHLSPSGAPISIDITSSQSPTAQPTTIPCTRIVLAAGAWTPQVFSTLFPTSKQLIPITPLAGHSLLLRTNKWTTGMESITSAQGGLGCHAIYSSTYTRGIGEWSPEIFSRAGGEIYIAGLNDATLPLPHLATDRVLEPEKLDIILQEAKRLIGVDQGSELQILRQGLCFRPVTDRGTPIVGTVREGVFVAAGHGPWGISLSLGTGRVVAEMLLGRELSADVGRLGL